MPPKNEWWDEGMPGSTPASCSSTQDPFPSYQSQDSGFRSMYPGSRRESRESSRKGSTGSRQDSFGSHILRLESYSSLEETQGKRSKLSSHGSDLDSIDEGMSGWAKGRGYCDKEDLPQLRDTNMALPGNVNAESEDDDQGMGFVDFCVMAKYYQHPGIGCLVLETPDLAYTTVGTATLITYDDATDAGTVLTPMHVWDNARNGRVRARDGEYTAPQQHMRRHCVKVCFNDAIRIGLQPSHKVVDADAVVRGSSEEELDYVILKIEPLGGRPHRPLEQVLIHPSTPTDSIWRSFKSLTVFGHPPRDDGIVKPTRCFRTKYLGRVGKDVARIILGDDRSDPPCPDIRMALTKLSSDDRGTLRSYAGEQMEMVREAAENVHDAHEAVELVKSILEAAKKRSGVVENGRNEAAPRGSRSGGDCNEGGNDRWVSGCGEAGRGGLRGSFAVNDVIASQLHKLLHPRRFLIEKCGLRWGFSGSVVVAPNLAGGDVVGVFLCGFPQPTSDAFQARHFKIMQSLKTEAVEWE